MKKIVKFKSKNNKLNKKKVLWTAIVSIVIFLLLVAVIIYKTNGTFRKFTDKYIFRKDVTEENVPSIEIDYESNTNIIPYGKYICILAENTLFEYNMQMYFP